MWMYSGVPPISSHPPLKKKNYCSSRRFLEVLLVFGHLRPWPPDAPGSSCSFLSQTWNQPFLLGVMPPFSGEHCLEIRVWLSTTCVHCYWGIIASHSFVDRARKCAYSVMSSCWYPYLNHNTTGLFLTCPHFHITISFFYNENVVPTISKNSLSKLPYRPVSDFLHQYHYQQQIFKNWGFLCSSVCL